MGDRTAGSAAGAAGAAGRPGRSAQDRRSRLPESSSGSSAGVSRAAPREVRLLSADLHNHSLLSDGAGDPRRAFAEMRAAGLDVAALTDHASIPYHALGEVDPADYPDEAAYRLAMSPPVSLDDAGWAAARELADAADVPGEFTALRGFEWTEPWLGHANVWFSEAFLPVRTPGRLDGLHRFLTADEPDALYGYNHPGREPGRFAGFAYAGELAPRLVSIEVFNRFDDYLFEGWASGLPSPVAACLDAGWRPGVAGASDEHGRHYGLVGKGRTGLWAVEHSRSGVREALLARRTFATREAGLLLDAALDGVRMGGELPDRAIRRELAVDLRARGHDGRPVELQLLGAGPGGEPPSVLARLPARVGDVTRVDVMPPRSPWLLLRVADPARRNGTPGPAGHPGNAYGLAYASPWYLPA